MATNSEDLNHIEELSVDVANDCYWSSNVNHIALLHQQLLRLRTNGLHHRVREKLLSIEPGDAFVKVDVGYEAVESAKSPPNKILSHRGVGTYWEDQALWRVVDAMDRVRILYS